MKSKLRVTHIPYFSSTLLATLALFLFFGAVLFSQPKSPQSPQVYLVEEITCDTDNDCGNHSFCSESNVCVCQAPYADCNNDILSGNSGNGCEVDISNDNFSCGRCDYDCEPGQVCHEGECGPSCIQEGNSGNWAANDWCCEGLAPIDVSNPPGCYPAESVFICAKCPDGTCGPGENECNCPDDCKEAPAACIEEGETGQVYLGAPSCCSGLKSIAKASLPDCMPLDGAFICAFCPDGTCGPGENECNCPKDCISGTCTTDADCGQNGTCQDGVCLSRSISGITLQVKLDGVPANNNDHCGEDYCNLPHELRTQLMSVLIERESNGEDVYEAEVEFKYIGDGIWEGQL